MKVKAYGVRHAQGHIEQFDIDRRSLLLDDVLIDIHYCGICHSDIHQAKNEWKNSLYPMVPGHEIVGVVKEVGQSVTRFKVGDHVGVGCMVDSCLHCVECQSGLEQYCDHTVYTYNSYEKDGVTKTFGGYAKQIVVKENFVLKLSSTLPLEVAAPLLCAGITTYSPLKHWNVKPGSRVGVIGLGGLGHMAVKLASAMGAEVVVYSTSESKRQDAMRLGATHFVMTRDELAAKAFHRYCDLIINTAASNIDLSQYVTFMKRDGVMVLVAVPEHPMPLNSSMLISKRYSLAGSLIGGISETQEMLDFCAQHGITSDVEVIHPDAIEAAYDRVIKGQVKYRFVIDLRG